MAFSLKRLLVSVVTLLTLLMPNASAEPGLQDLDVPRPIVMGPVLLPRLPEPAPAELSARAAVPGACYYPDGTLARDFNYTADPNITSGYAPCCDRTLGDIFLPGGYCFFPSIPNHGAYVYRASCTDKSWKSDRCPQMCTQNTPNRWEALVFCPSSTFCCQKSAKEGSCCDDLEHLNITVPKFPESIMSTLTSVAAEETAIPDPKPASSASGLVTSVTPAPRSATTTPKPRPLSPTTFITSPSAPTSSTITSAPPSSSSSPPANDTLTPTPTNLNSSKGLSTENIISLVLGLVLGLPTLLVTAWMCFHPHEVSRGAKAYIVNPVREFWGGEKDAERLGEVD